MSVGITFRTCPKCQGYGVLDNGRNCRECGGSGSGGLHGQGTIGCGEIFFDAQTGARVTYSEYARRLREQRSEREQASLFRATEDSDR